MLIIIELIIEDMKRLVKESSDYTIDNEAIKCFELVNDQKVGYCEIRSKSRIL